MRPYFIPERSRTKSENSVELESYSSSAPNYSFASLASTATATGTATGTGTGAATNTICVDAMNSNSNSMMETCDAYLNSDFNGPSCSTTTFNGFPTINCNSVLPNSHFLNSNQYFRPIKSHSLTNQLKKCKSLENVRVENIDGSQPSHEMEFVSSRIQKLKVQE